MKDRYGNQSLLYLKVVISFYFLSFCSSNLIIVITILHVCKLERLDEERFKSSDHNESVLKETSSLSFSFLQFAQKNDIQSFDENW